MEGWTEDTTSFGTSLQEMPTESKQLKVSIGWYTTNNYIPDAAIL